MNLRYVNKIIQKYSNFILVGVIVFISIYLFNKHAFIEGMTTTDASDASDATDEVTDSNENIDIVDSPISTDATATNDITDDMNTIDISDTDVDIAKKIVVSPELGYLEKNGKLGFIINIYNGFRNKENDSTSESNNNKVNTPSLSYNNIYASLPPSVYNPRPGQNYYASQSQYSNPSQYAYSKYLQNRLLQSSQRQEAPFSFENNRVHSNNLRVQEPRPMESYIKL